MTDIKSHLDILLFDDFFEEQEKLGTILVKSSSISTEAREEGNQLYKQNNHNQNIHKAILFQYTKSIAFAPRESEELALAYYNRSVLLLHLQLFKESLLDVYHALRFTRSNNLKAKLEACQKKCAEILGAEVDIILADLITNLYHSGNKICTKQKNDTELELPDIKPSSILPCASKSVTISYNETFGRHLIATQDIKPGEVILIEKGYTCFPKDSQLYLVCSHCLQFLWNVLPCIHCPFAVYCSEACRHEAWQEYHDEECKILPYLYYKEDANITDVRAIARMLIKVLKKEGLHAVLNQAKATCNANSDDFGGLLSNGTLDSNRFWSCYNLKCHTRQNKIFQSRYNFISCTQDSTIKEDEYFYESMIVSLLHRLTDLVSNELNVKSVNVACGDEYDKMYFFDGKKLIQLRNILVRLRNILGVNSQKYQAYLCYCSDVNECNKNCDSNRGIMISPCSSLPNHSYSPNVGKMFLPKGKILLFTTALIKEGEQIFDSHASVLRIKIERRQAISEDDTIQLKMLSELKKSFKNEETIYYINKTVDQWKFDKETLQCAKKWIKLIYTHYKKEEASIQSRLHKVYINTAFYKLFGEQCTVPSDCST